MYKTCMVFDVSDFEDGTPIEVNLCAKDLFKSRTRNGLVTSCSETRLNYVYIDEDGDTVESGIDIEDIRSGDTTIRLFVVQDTHKIQNPTEGSSKL